MADPARLTGLSGSLVLVRHGETTWITEGRFQGRSDPPLSPLGEFQAVRVTERLVSPSASPALPLPPTAPLGVWHSPLQRAAVVARGIAAGHGAPLTPLDDLMELDQGAWEGLTSTEVEARYGEELVAWRRDPLHHHAPGGESLDVAGVRAGDAAETLLEALRVAVEAQRPPGWTVRPSTSHVIGYGTPGADGEPWPWLVAVAHDGLLRLLVLDLLGLPRSAFWSFPFALCAVTIVEVRAGVARLRAHNLADHLDGLAPAAPAGLPSR